MSPAAFLRQHWPEYLIEAWALGTFMVSAIVFTALLEYPGSPVHALVPNAHVRRAVVGLAMGLTAIGLIYSPWGQRSGAHMNPATTLTFLRLGKVQPWDAVFYILAQCLGGLGGVWLSRLWFGSLLAHPSVNYVATVPGPWGVGLAFLAETLLAGGLMGAVLWFSNTPGLARCTGLVAGTLVFLYITFEAPLSGMSINPARTVASALPSGIWNGGWVYLTAPILGMLLAAQLYRTAVAVPPQACPKLHHGTRQRCIFCGHAGQSETQGGGFARPVASNPSCPSR